MENKGFSQIPDRLHIPPKYSELFKELFALQNMADEAVIGCKLYRINLVFWETAAYTSPKLTLTLSSYLEKNDGLGEGQVGSFPET